uniref:Uncharacterized protein n=1 Tax=Timema cristinae TaxID=61476 RepID=A0A7R9GWT4_TIMCR|nr:unnamed protein product [Timema cristinae]
MYGTDRCFPPSEKDKQLAVKSRARAVYSDNTCLRYQSDDDNKPEYFVVKEIENIIAANQELADRIACLESIMQHQAQLKSTTVMRDRGSELFSRERRCLCMCRTTSRGNKENVNKDYYALPTAPQLSGQPMSSQITSFAPAHNADRYQAKMGRFMYMCACPCPLEEKEGGTFLIIEHGPAKQNVLLRWCLAINAIHICISSCLENRQMWVSRLKVMVPPLVRDSSDTVKSTGGYTQPLGEFEGDPTNLVETVVVVDDDDDDDDDVDDLVR